MFERWVSAELSKTDIYKTMKQKGNWRWEDIKIILCCKMSVCPDR